jgi:ABC-type branched-subunit amino acid transport system substrate-binding protein
MPSVLQLQNMRLIRVSEARVIHVNNDFGEHGQRISKAYRPCMNHLGYPYNEKQPSYQAEVTAAGGTLMVSISSAIQRWRSIARQWISQGGTPKFLLNDGMNSADFITVQGNIDDAFGTPRHQPTPSTDYFMKNYKEFSGIEPSNPALIVPMLALSLQPSLLQAGKADSMAIGTRTRFLIQRVK